MELREWVVLGVATVGIVSAYFQGRLDGAQWAREQMVDASKKWLRKYYPNGVPEHARNDLDVMGQTIESLVRQIEKSIKRTEHSHGK